MTDANQEHFDHIVSEYVAYYLDRRPHKGIGNFLVPRRHIELAEATGDADDVAEPLSLADIKCERHLGGLLKHFYRQAA
jgi:hypothetical protein